MFQNKGLSELNKEVTCDLHYHAIYYYKGVKLSETKESMTVNAGDSVEIKLKGVELSR